MNVIYMSYLIIDGSYLHATHTHTHTHTHIYIYIYINIVLTTFLSDDWAHHMKLEVKDFLSS